MTRSELLRDAGQLLAYATNPKATPARDAAYSDLVGRYRSDTEYREACDAVAAGLGVTLVVDSTVGVVAVPTIDATVRMPTREFQRRTDPQARRVFLAATLLAFARSCYLAAEMLDDALRVPSVTAGTVNNYLGRLIAKLDEESEGDDIVDENELVQVWRQWAALPAVSSQAKYTANSTTQHGVVLRVGKFLEAEGMLVVREDRSDQEREWRATPRFRVAVAALAEDSDLFHSLHGMAESETVS